MDAIYVLWEVDNKTIIEDTISEQDPKRRLLKISTNNSILLLGKKESIKLYGNTSYQGSFMVTQSYQGRPSCTLILMCNQSTDPSIELATACSARKFMSNTEHMMMIRETMLNGMTQRDIILRNQAHKTEEICHMEDPCDLVRIFLLTSGP